MGDLFDPGNVKQMLAMCAYHIKCIMNIVMSHVKEETWTFWHMNAPTVGPGMKSTGAGMSLRHAKD